VPRRLPCLRFKKSGNFFENSEMFGHFYRVLHLGPSKKYFVV
jgi:hypothetical protein